MSKKKDDSLPETILQLSDMLRYQLYECDEDSVPLSKEIEYINNYINIEKLRRSDIEIQLNTNRPIATKFIKPLILLPFVENAFKYSKTDGIEKSIIHISIEVLDNDFSFTCINDIGTYRSNEIGGIGLTNATRRLELAYPDNHTLSHYEKDGQYHVELKITNI